MTVEYQPFEDVSPIKDDDFLAIAMLVFVGVPSFLFLVFRGSGILQSSLRTRLR